MHESSSKPGRFKRRIGGTIPGSDDPAFELFEQIEIGMPILIAVPHAGRSYPYSVSRNLRSARYSCLRLEDRYADLIGERLAKATGASLLVARAPRAIIDLNRARDDIDWGMVEGGGRIATSHSQNNRRARSGLGLVPRRLHGLGEIWKRRLDPSELEARINAIHRPYHLALAAELERIRDCWGTALLLDLHSMPPLRPSAGEQLVPQFVIGDRFGASCARAISDSTLEYFESQGQRAVLNRPYAGGFVLDHHSALRRSIHALQLEVCRSCYLDADLDSPGAKLDSLVELLEGLVYALAQATAQQGKGRPQALAAE